MPTNNTSLNLSMIHIKIRLNTFKFKAVSFGVIFGIILCLNQSIFDTLFLKAVSFGIIFGVIFGIIWYHLVSFSQRYQGINIYLSINRYILYTS